MAEPYRIKQGDTLPILPVSLLDDTGAPFNLTGETVTVRIVSAYAPYAPIVPNVPAVIRDQSNPDLRGQVYYQWGTVAGDTSVPGDYLAEWYVTDSGKVRTVPGDDYTRIEIIPNLGPSATPIVPVASLGEIETAMGRPLTPLEAARADQLVQGLTAELSLWLYRDLQPTTHLNERHVSYPGHDGALAFSWGPVRQVLTVGVGTQDPVDWTGKDWSRGYGVPPGVGAYYVSYVSGDDVVHGAVRAVIRDTVARTILAGVIAGAGVIGSYTVEGTTISYSPSVTGKSAFDKDQIGKMAVGDTNALKRLQRVMAG